MAAVEARPGFSMDGVEKIETALSQGSAAGGQVHGAFTRLVARIRTSRKTSAIRSDRASYDIGADGDAALGQLATGRDELIYVACKHVGERWPDSFGVQAKEGMLEERLATLKTKYEALKSEIETFPLVIGPAGD